MYGNIFLAGTQEGEDEDPGGFLPLVAEETGGIVVRQAEEIANTR